MESQKLLGTYLLVILVCRMDPVGPVYQTE